MTAARLPRVCTISFCLLLAGASGLGAQPIAATAMNVGRRPTSAVFSFDSREAWVVSAGSNAVSIVDLTTPFVHETIPVNFVPDQISSSSDGSLAFVTSQDRPYSDGFPADDCSLVVVEPQGGRVTIIETRTRRIAGTLSIPSGRPILALPARRGDRLFVVTENGTVEVFNVVTRARLTTVTLGGGQVFDAVLHPDDRKLFITRYTATQDLLVLDTANYGSRTVSLASFGYRAFFGGRLTVDPSGQFLFVNVAASASFARYTMAFDPRTEAPRAFVPGGFGGIAFRPDGKRAYLFSPEFAPAAGAEGVTLELPGLTAGPPLPVGGQSAAIARDGSAIYLARYGAPFRYIVSVGDPYQFRYDLTTFQPATGGFSGQDVHATPVRCTVRRDVILSPDGRNLLLTNPAVDTVTWFTIPTPAAGTAFYTVPPCRLADSRLSPGTLALPHGGPSLAGGASRILPATAHCGIPTTARAVTVNLTATGAGTGGHLSVFPGGGALPNTSTINFAAARSRANSATIPLGPSGALTVSAALPAGTVDFVVDVLGYWQ